MPREDCQEGLLLCHMLMRCRKVGSQWSRGKGSAKHSTSVPPSYGWVSTAQDREHRPKADAAKCPGTGACFQGQKQQQGPWSWAAVKGTCQFCSQKWIELCCWQRAIASPGQIMFATPKQVCPLWPKLLFVNVCYFVCCNSILVLFVATHWLI